MIPGFLQQILLFFTPMPNPIRMFVHFEKLRFPDERPGADTMKKIVVAQE